MRRLSTLGVVLAAAGFCVAAPGEHKTPTIPELIQQLSSNDYQIRQRAARRLGNLGLAARDAVPALAKALHDPMPDVRGPAGKALGQIGTPAVPALIEALRHKDNGVRDRAARALAQCGPDAKEAVPDLIAALKDRQTDVRVAAVDALGEMGAEGKEAAPALARLFHDPSNRVREHVIVALSAMVPAAVEPLCDALGEDDPKVRLDAIKTIALFGSAAKKAVPTLRHAMKDEDHHIRAAAAEALGKMELDAADAVPELLAALRDKNRLVHDKVANALVIMTAAGVPDLLEKVRQTENKNRWLEIALPTKGTAQNPLTPLLKELVDTDPQVRIKTALTLGSLGAQAKSALPALRKVLADDNVQVRLSAAMAIAHIQRNEAEIPLAVQRTLRAVRDEMEDLQKLLSASQRYSPAVQAQLRNFIMAYIILKVTSRAGTDTRMYDRYLDNLGPEALPAVVDGVNVVAGLGLGDC
jgi:HEAT repeat protein